MYAKITQAWRYSINNGYDLISKILLKLLNSKWLKRYDNLPHKALPYKRGLIIEFIFDIFDTGDLSPNLLGSIFITIIQHPKISKFNGNISVILTAFYEGDVKSIAPHYLLTSTSTAEDFINHFISFTDKVGHGESKVVLTNAQYIKAKVVKL